MKLKKTAQVQFLGGQAIIVDTDVTNDAFLGIIKLNSSAAIIVDLLKEEQTLDSLVAAICDEYEVTEPQARADVDFFISQLRSAGMIVD